MEKKFILAGKKAHTSEVITTIAIVLLYAGIIWQPDLGCQRVVASAWGITETVMIVLGIILMLGAFFWLSGMKHFKQGGSLLFNARELKIVKGDITEIIPVEMTSGMRLVYQGIEGEPKSHSGILGMVGFTTTTDGSGNMLQFRFNAMDYSLNLVFEAKEDLNAIWHLFREIGRIHGFHPELIDRSGDSFQE